MTRRLLLITGMTLLVAAPVLWAQVQSQAVDPASLSALTTEVRQIRLAIEESTRAQTQTQATAVYLTVQKDRIFQLTTRLDALRKDLDAVATEERRLARDIEGTEKALLDPNVPQALRQQLPPQLADLKRTHTDASLREQQLRAREQEVVQSLQLEEARWNDLISRMEQAIKR